MSESFAPTAVERAEIDKRAHQAVYAAIAALLDLAPSNLAMVQAAAAAAIRETYPLDGWGPAGRRADTIARETLRAYLGGREVVVGTAFRCRFCGGTDRAACDPCISDPAWQGPR